MTAKAIKPAYDTKDHRVLHIPIALPGSREITFELEQSDAFLDTTGTTLWLGGQVLAAYILSLNASSSEQGQKGSAIDLGAGLGLVSLTLSACGWNTVATDLPVLTEGLLGLNIEKNQDALVRIDASGKLAAHSLDWCSSYQQWNDELKQPFELIVSSDSIYMEALVEPLLNTIRRLCDIALQAGQRPNAYIAYEHRDDAQYTTFVAKAEVIGLKVRPVPPVKMRKAVHKAYAWSPEVYTGITVLHMKP